LYKEFKNSILEEVAARPGDVCGTLRCRLHTGPSDRDHHGGRRPVVLADPDTFAGNLGGTPECPALPGDYSPRSGDEPGPPLDSLRPICRSRGRCRGGFHNPAAQHPDHLEQVQRILGIPFKKNNSRIIDYLEYYEIQEILSVIDRNTSKGRRDYALLSTMFNTGARVQEILNLKACDLQLTKPFQVRLMGKGRKQRVCPIWPQTAQLLRRLCMEMKIDLSAEVSVFRNCQGAPLTRFGVRYILNNCLKHAQDSIPNLRSKRIHPHSMRHSTAVALIKSGVDLSTISQWLGHSSLDTTNRYAAIDLEMKRKAIESIKPVQDKRAITVPWHRDKTIIEWLESL